MFIIAINFNHSLSDLSTYSKPDDIKIIVYHVVCCIAAM